MSAEPGLGALPRLLRFIRFSHTIFALPFALGSMLVAARGLPPTAHHRADHPLHGLRAHGGDGFQPARGLARSTSATRARRIGTGSSRAARRLVCFLASLAFIATTWWINWLCFLLSPVALVIVFFYSLTKRFTAGSHFFLGLALSVSPVGAWLAVAGQFCFGATRPRARGALLGRGLRPDLRHAGLRI